MLLSWGLICQAEVVSAGWFFLLTRSLFLLLPNSCTEKGMTSKVRHLKLFAGLPCIEIFTPVGKINHIWMECTMKLIKPECLKLNVTLSLWFYLYFYIFFQNINWIWCVVMWMLITWLCFFVNWHSINNWVKFIGTSHQWLSLHLIFTVK